MREYLTRKIYGGVVFALAIFGTTILAVSISGTIKTWTTGEVLKSADLNTTIASLQTAIQNIPNWTKAANGNDAYYTAGNVGIKTTIPTTALEINGVLSFQDVQYANTKNSNNGISAEIGGKLINFGLNDGIYNRFGGSYNQADQGGFLRLSSWSSAPLLQIFGRQAGTASDVSSLVTVTSAGNMGIGTTSPIYKLHVSGADNEGIFVSSGTNKGYMFLNNPAYGIAKFDLQGTRIFTAAAATDMQFGITTGGTTASNLETNFSPKMTIVSATGFVGIGTTAPDQLLSVNGNASKATGGTAWAVFSDIRLKDQISPYTIGLKEVLQINPITYRYKKDNPLDLKGAEKEVGISAQDLQKIIPDAVKTSSKDYLQFHMDYVNWAMLNSIKEVAFRLRSGSDSIRQVSDRVSAVTDSVSVVTQKIESLEKEKAANEKKLLSLEEDNKRLRDTVETLRATSLRTSQQLEDRLRVIENTQMARK